MTLSTYILMLCVNTIHDKYKVKGLKTMLCSEQRLTQNTEVHNTDSWWDYRSG